MPRFTAVNAGKRNLNASKTISAGQFEAPQAKREGVLVCPMARGRPAKIERIRPLFARFEERSTCNARRDPSRHKPWSRTTAGYRTDISAIRRVRLSTDQEGRILEGIDDNDH